MAIVIEDAPFGIICESEKRSTAVCNECGQNRRRRRRRVTEKAEAAKEREMEDSQSAPPASSVLPSFLARLQCLSYTTCFVRCNDGGGDGDGNGPISESKRERDKREEEERDRRGMPELDGTAKRPIAPSLSIGRSIAG